MPNKDDVKRRAYNRQYMRKRRRARGVVPREEWLANSLTRTKPWEAKGLSKARYRRRAVRNDLHSARSLRFDGGTYVLRRNDEDR
jgi:hypothetical protein